MLFVILSTVKAYPCGKEAQQQTEHQWSEETNGYTRNC